MSLIPKDLTRVLQDTASEGVGAVRRQHPVWVDHLPPCNNACPAGEDIQGWLALARDGEFEAAWRRLVETNPLPGAHGRACYHPCETSCNRKDLDEAVAIHVVERFLGDLAVRNGWSVQPGRDTGKRILIVGAGPAGLSCAWHLRKIGHQVEVRDAMAEPGGMLHYGIPAYRLPRQELVDEISRIEAMGVRFMMNTRVNDVVADMNRGAFDACFIAIGTHVGNHLDIPAVDGSRIIDAVTMLEQVEEGRAPNMGRIVAVVGGGNTAMDAARVAKRLGAEEALLVYRRDREHMRADPYEADEAFLEGVRAKWLTNPTRFGKDGVTIEKIELKKDGSLHPTGQFETLPIDTLVLALGQHADVEFLRNMPELRFGSNDSLLVDEALMTGHPGIFAGGDVIGGLMTMTAATGHGRKAARSIDAWLSGRTPAVVGASHPIGFDELNLPLFLDAGRSRPSELPVELRHGFAEVVAGIGDAQARYESDRCLSCGVCFECDNCFAACPEQAILKLGRGKKYAVDLSLCTGCAVCFDQCPCHAIDMEAEVAESPAREMALSPAQFKPRA